VVSSDGTANTYCGAGVLTNMNPYTGSNEYSFVGASLFGGTIMGTGDIRWSDISAPLQGSGGVTWLMTNIEITGTGGGGDGGWVDSPPPGKGGTPSALGALPYGGPAANWNAWGAGASPFRRSGIALNVEIV
jgi:hypothetical protein